MIQAAYDVLIASDFADPCDCAASVAAEVAAQHRLGLRTALVHIGDPRAVVDPQVRRLVAAGLTDWVSPRRAVTAALLLLRRPSMLAAAGWRLAARADTTLIVADQLEADAARADARVREEVGGSPRWAPVGPLVRSDLTGRGLDLTEEDWNDVVDIDALRSPTRDSRAGTSVIGRTSARFAHGWPESAAVLLAAYPEARSPRVAVLGSIAAPKAMLRRRPRWRIASPDRVTLADFLAHLDVFVYFHASWWRDVCGRPLLEALAAGLPVVTHPYLEGTFGAACTYCEPRQVRPLVAKMLAGARQSNAAGVDLIRERFAYDAHRRRLDALLGRRLPVLGAGRRRPDRILFVTGEATSREDVARLTSLAADLTGEPLFLGMSAGSVSAFQQAGHWADFLPAASAALRAPEWPDYHAKRITSALRELHPAAVVVDGPAPATGVLQAIRAATGVARIWSLRGGDAPPRASREAFDVVVTAGELDAAFIDQRCAPPAVEDEAEDESAEASASERPPRSAMVRYPYAIFVRPVRKATRRMRRSWRRMQTRRGAREARLAALPQPAPKRAAALPGSGKVATSRVLVLVSDEPAEAASVDRLIDWVWRSPRGAVVLAPASLVERLREHGVTAETLLPRGTNGRDRLDFSGYFCQKIRLLRDAYNCGPVLFWDGTARDHHFAELLHILD